MNKVAVNLIVETLGSDAITAAIPKLGPHAVRAARTKGFLPAHSFDVVEAMCREAGIPCPRSAFSFSKPSIAIKSGNAPASRQGEAAE